MPTSTTEMRVVGQDQAPQQPNPKHDRFRRLATKRVNRALEALDMVARLSNPGNSYSQEEADKIVGVLNDQVAEVARRLSRTKSASPQFAFD